MSITILESSGPCWIQIFLLALSPFYSSWFLDTCRFYLLSMILTVRSLHLRHHHLRSSELQMTWPYPSPAHDSGWTQQCVFSDQWQPLYAYFAWRSLKAIGWSVTVTLSYIACHRGDRGEERFGHWEHSWIWTFSPWLLPACQWHFAVGPHMPSVRSKEQYDTKSKWAAILLPSLNSSPRQWPPYQTAGYPGRWLKMTLDMLSQNPH